MITYDLTTARGVLLALADGHALVDGHGARLLIDGHEIRWSHGASELEIALIDTRPWFLAPKAVESMGVPELARELYGDGVIKVGDQRGWKCIWQQDAMLLSAPTSDALVKTLRALVKAKRAGEL